LTEFGIFAQEVTSQYAEKISTSLASVALPNITWRIFPANWSGLALFLYAHLYPVAQVK
jgi:hypothetical protein